MSIYRRNYWTVTKDGKKERRTSEHYTIETRHPETGKIVRKRGPKDRKAAKKMEQDLITALERGQAGLVDEYKEFRAVSIFDCIDTFIANLKAKHCDDMYVYTAEKRLRRLALEAKWRRLFDASQRSFEEWRATTAKRGYQDRPTAAKTLNQFLSLAVEFFDWCVDTGRMDKNPLAKANKSREVSNDTYRRAATPEEIAKFLAKLPSDHLRRFYIFVAYTGLRRATLETLRWGDLYLNGDEPHILVRGADNKTRRQQRFALRADLAKMMREGWGETPDGARVFPHVPTIDEHREYLAAADIKFDDGKGGHRLDLHAFRKTLQMWLEDAGVDVREASKALGHLHLTTTLKSYREKRDAKRLAGVERLPSLIENARSNGEKSPERSA